MEMDGRIDADIQEFVSTLNSRDARLVREILKVVLQTVPQAEETILWGGLSYHRPEIGGRVKGAICQITAKHGDARLEFIHGIRLPDPTGLLGGNRVSKRYIVLRTVEDVKRPEVESLIRKAAELDPTEWC